MVTFLIKMVTSNILRSRENRQWFCQHRVLLDGKKFITSSYRNNCVHCIHTQTHSAQPFSSIWPAKVCQNHWCQFNMIRMILNTKIKLNSAWHYNCPQPNEKGNNSKCNGNERVAVAMEEWINETVISTHCRKPVWVLCDRNPIKFTYIRMQLTQSPFTRSQFIRKCLFG